jgi:hypothetical protein
LALFDAIALPLPQMAHVVSHQGAENRQHLAGGMKNGDQARTEKTWAR